MSILGQYLDTPIGLLAIREQDDAICAIEFVETMDSEPVNTPLLLEAKKQLQDYFNGSRKAFNLPLKAKGTLFQQQVWEQLQSVCYGQTASYADIANKVANPKAVRAVGAANGKNPIAIVVPCHRIIGSNGRLTGYAGGLERKAFLLDLERGLRLSGNVT
ncbi:methylated-DNA--[protein]-cysteine S-methyltransferase [Aliiglaciecola sp. CAU 1673]|uniref:methylated-DNA--[protein]-cysteine S-methyltransferase n=1 Tax=Aliiglaciecola sp. CAU 1673 TaxID=3032595 RepID=UPI0023DC8CD9|nr:methylated-DNA--[protein]-cysteine S-methyltransferase [Aliiglaciecola sp. CAU 1673]MDF2179661.1 methylated-DNA--[protein]-cysteine S-methyltransferase [Aliiglaciecola sp. CAU 1673]